MCRGAPLSAWAGRWARRPAEGGYPTIPSGAWCAARASPAGSSVVRGAAGPLAAQENTVTESSRRLFRSAVNSRDERFQFFRFGLLHPRNWRISSIAVRRAPAPMTPRPYRKSNSGVSMMQASEEQLGDDAAERPGNCAKAAESLLNDGVGVIRGITVVTKSNEKPRVRP